jgi:hypothetical protein
VPISPQASFASTPQPTVFIVNVIHAHPGRQDEAFAIIEDVVRHASGKAGFLWSNLSRSTDGQTVVNIEAIADPDRVNAFFGDPVFVEKFARLDAVSTSEFHTYQVDALIFPALAGALGS